MSEKVQKLDELRMSGFPVPKYTFLASEDIHSLSQDDIDVVVSQELCDTGKVIVRSAHPLEGKKDLPWTGVFHTEEYVDPTVDAVLAAYDKMRADDFKPLRYARRHSVEDFSIDDLGILVMGQFDTQDYERYAHTMMRQVPEDARSDEAYYPDIEFVRNGIYSGFSYEPKFEREVELFRTIEKHLGTTQEVELITANNQVYVVQSRDFTPFIIPEDILPMHDEFMAYYVIDESKKTPEEIEADLYALGLRAEKYCVITHDLSVSVWDHSNRGKMRNNMGYTSYLEEAADVFLLNGSFRPFGSHYEWDVNASRLQSFYGRDIPTITKKIERDGEINPSQLQEILHPLSSWSSDTL